MNRPPTRRDFIAQSAAVGFGLPLVIPSTVFGANERLQIAGVGVGGKGRGDIASTSVGQAVVAICDVDDRTLAASASLYPSAKKYNDWRRLLDQKDIDAVTVSTPDHMHAPIAVSAMQRGKHVYVQKPLAHTLYEARQMRLIAKKHGVVTQMGNQGHSGTGYMTLVKLIQSGVIGKVKEAHAWSNRPIWPQGVERPQGSDPVPDHLHWDLWLGVARERPFVGPQPGRKKNRGVYHPFNWRGWLDFGVGALGDMGCHIIDPVVWSCGLGSPTAVRSSGPKPNDETFPNWGIITYEFSGTKHTADSLNVTWYDGGKKPDQALLPADQPPLPDNGSLFVGDHGVLLCRHGGTPQLFPSSKFAKTEIALVPAHDHYLEWTNSCKGQGKTTSHFDYAGPLTETVLLGTVAIRFPNQRLEWNSETMKFPNLPAADAFVHHAYRQGWDVDGLSG